MRQAITSALLALAAMAALAAPTITRDADNLGVDLGNGCKLRFALEQGYLLGLQTATADGTALKSDATVVRPYLIEEWSEAPMAWEHLALRDVKVDGDAVKITCDLVAGDAQAASRLFVMQGGKPFRDYYLFAHVQLPAEAAKVSVQREAVRGLPANPAARGTLTWVVEPVTTNVAGWAWHGWKHHYEVALANGKKVNCIRELGTWETQGQACGNTLVSLRYRGLGGIAPKLEPLAGDAGPVKNSFTTTEILPGAVGAAPVVSPAVPGPQLIADRAEGMKYRHGAWIAQMQRGGGANWVDFQYRPTVGLAAWYDRMDAIRSLTEVWPGDTQVSQTDCLYFPLTDTFSTVPKVHIALTTKALPDYEWHTRWQEMDQYVRDHISTELGFVQHDPLPSVGINIDSAWAWNLPSHTGRVEAWKAAGVKRAFFHHPGWFNGRGLRQKETAFPIPQRLLTDPKKPDQPATMQNDTGGDCSIHDYVPQSDKTRDLWVALAKKLNGNDIEHWGWITGMVYGTGPVVGKFGEARFCKNGPTVDFSSGYPGSAGRAGHRGISMRDPEIKAWWEGRMAAAEDDLGMQGFWLDSFQNMFMSQMNYQQPDQAPQVREWWAWMAEASRKGVGVMSESQAFPALSCSIEVGGNPEDWEGTWWTMPYVTRWYRGSFVPNKGTEKADRLFFRSMANKGPICPGGGDTSQIPSMGRMSAEYMAALPAMRRPFQLADDKGVLWLANGGDGEGVLFSFTEGALPAGVTAEGLVDHARAETLKPHATYAVKATDLLAAFGIARGPEKDPRIGQPYTPPVRYQKKW
jgi:hypothetical protein